MLIYNVTTHVEPSIETQWIDWMNNTHMPEMMATGKFIKILLLKVVTEDSSKGRSYAAQYHCKNRSAFDAYLKEDATLLRKNAVKKFGDKILSFRTELEQIAAIQ